MQVHNRLRTKTVPFFPSFLDPLSPSSLFVPFCIHLKGRHLSDFPRSSFMWDSIYEQSLVCGLCMMRCVLWYAFCVMRQRSLEYSTDCTLNMKLMATASVDTLKEPLVVLHYYSTPAKEEWFSKSERFSALHGNAKSISILYLTNSYIDFETSWILGNFGKRNNHKKDSKDGKSNEFWKLQERKVNDCLLYSRFWKLKQRLVIFLCEWFLSLNRIRNS